MRVFSIHIDVMQSHNHVCARLRIIIFHRAGYLRRLLLPLVRAELHVIGFNQSDLSSSTCCMISADMRMFSTCANVYTRVFNVSLDYYAATGLHVAVV